MAVRIDPKLGSPPPLRAPDSLGGAAPLLALAGPAGGVPFLLEGVRGAVTGRETSGGHTLWVDGRRVASGLRTDGGPAANVIVAPASLRREVQAPSGTLLEQTLMAPALPLMVVQWSSPLRPGGPAAMGMSLVLLPGAADVRYLVSPHGVRAVAGDGGAVELRVHPPPLEWSAGGAAGGGLEVRATTTLGPVTLVVAAGDTPDAAGRAAAAGNHLAALDGGAAAEWDPPGMDTLALATGIREVDSAFAWCAARVRGALTRPRHAEPEALFWSAVGALAVGDGAAASRALASLRDPGQGASSWLSTLLAARLTLLTGDTGPALTALDDLAGGEAPGLAGAPAAPNTLQGIALHALADALRHAAPPQRVAALREAALLAEASSRGGGGSRHGRARRLPTVGAPAPRYPWTPWASLDADPMWQTWRRRLSAGIAGDAERGRGRGSWDPLVRGPEMVPAPGGSPEGGRLLCELSQGLLGVEPDAVSGRLRIAPAVPADLQVFSARGIRIGDVSVGLDYLREGASHRFTLDPVSGRVPVMAVLEPSVPVSMVRDVRVDGVPADLEILSAGSRCGLRVQFPLDGPRTLEVTEGR